MVLGLRHTVRKLEAYNNSPYPILSAYLDLSQVQPLHEQFTHSIKRSLSAQTQTYHHQDIDYISAFLFTYKPKATQKGLAIFSGGNNLWEVISTPFSLPDYVVVDYAPFLSPVVKQMAESNRYLVILADKMKAKFFTLYKGQLENQGEIFDTSFLEKLQITGHADKQPHISQHDQEHLTNHFQVIARRIQELTQNKKINGVIIGGHKELLHQVEEQLPRQLKEKVVAEFISELNISLSEIVERSKQIVSTLHKDIKFQFLSTVI